jgi:protein O-GlcNAc transferase
MKKNHVRHLDAALAHQRAGRFDEAAKAYRRILAKTPNNFDCVYLLATLYAQQGNLSGALALFRRAAALKPDEVDVLYNLAVALSMTGNHKEAAEKYKTVLERHPGHLNARNNYAASLLKIAQYADALDQYSRLLALNPGIAEAHINRGIALQNLRRFDEALAAYDQAITINPNNPEAYVTRGNLLTNIGRSGDALADYNKAISLQPDFSAAYNARMHLSDWSDIDSQRSDLVALVKRGSTEYPWGILAFSSSPEEQLGCARAFSRTIKPPAADPVWRGEIYKHDRIRVAYVSADFRVHAMSQLMVNLYECHDKSRFEISGISIGPNDHSGIRDRLEAAFERFIDAEVMSDDEIAARVKQLEIDILIDLNGFTLGARTGVFARRPAPIQVNYLGYPGTMGADFIDYLIADATLIPPPLQKYYAEKIVSLPDSYQVNDRKRFISDRVLTRSEAGIPASGFVFCCFNNNYKILPNVFDSWMRILAKVDGSVLWLFEDNPAAAANLRKEAVARGISAERLVFATRMPPSEHLARQRLADLFLDTLPYNAHTTGSDALWVGLPVLTRIGETFAARVAASLLNAIGLPELITETPDEYESAAIDLAMDAARLAAIKAKIAQNRLTTPLFDTQLFTQNIERAFEAMHKRYQSGLPPDHFTIGDSAPAHIAHSQG